MENESRAKTYLERKAWTLKQSGVDQIAVEVCPLCQHDGFKFFMNASGTDKDGLWDCKHCGEHGNLASIKERLGDNADGLVSLQGMATASGGVPPIPDVMVPARALHNNPNFADVLDYLVAGRGFRVDVLEKMSIGAEENYGKKWVVIPYFNKQGNVTYVKYRSVPPAKKEFRSTAGREVGLYNEAIIRNDMEEILFVEGESDTLACMSYGIADVVGLPGANVKKAAWITKIDAAVPKKIFLLYDNDKVGQTAARDMASKLGIEKCFNLCLPAFQTKDGKPGKDINEWFRSGHTLEEFETLKLNARPFDVNGVKPLVEVVEEIIIDIENHGTNKFELDTPWSSLNSKLGGANYGDVIGIIAEGKVGKTTMALNWLDYYATLGINSLMLCLEMPQKALVRKWVTHKMGVDDDKLIKENVQDALQVAKTMNGDLLFGFTRAGKVDEVFDIIRQAVRRYGVKVVAFDNLQFLIRSIDHATQETSRVSKMFKELAMELNILVLLVVQPHRVREGEIVSARNANGSSAIEKDVDAMIALHRKRVAQIKADDFNGYLEADENFEPQLLVRVDLSRYASGGVCTLFIDGKKSTIREMGMDDRAVIPKAPSAAITDEVATMV
jgi:KaiC/GvpD/RAD55 family RecA-like ATPase/5S rRNA maturation endonuclease (ribonuclease M5)